VHVEFARGLLFEGWISFRLGKSLEAEGKSREALKTLRSTLGARHPALAEALHRAGRSDNVGP
jgi:hypothetical protein